MTKLTGIAAGLLLTVACGYAFGQSASFGVSLRVLSDGPLPELPAELPVPPQAQRLPPSRDTARLIYAGSALDARRFYEDTLPELGFYQTAQKTDGAVWERADMRAELSFYPVVGVQDATGILVTMRPRVMGSAKR